MKVKMLVAFYKGRNRIDNRVTSWWTNGPYSHVEIVIDESDGKYLCASSSGMDSGVRLKWMELPKEKWSLLEIKANPVAVAKWFNIHLGESYDKLGLFGFIGRRGTQEQSKWFCSEAVAASLNFKEPWRLDPNTLATVLEFSGGKWKVQSADNVSVE